MTRFMHREIEKIRRLTLSLGSLVEDRLRMATCALEDHDIHTVQKVIQSDFEVDEMEVEVEEECLKILALHQPVAIDLRFLVAVIKITNELERVGDLAVNIARNVITMSMHASRNLDFDYSRMAEKAENMVRMSLDALVHMDGDMAQLVVRMDDEVDRILCQAYDRIKDRLQHAPEKAGYFINLLLVSRHLERLADHATNIAEEIIYLIDGAIVRHRQTC